MAVYVQLFSFKKYKELSKYFTKRIKLSTTTGLRTVVEETVHSEAFKKSKFKAIATHAKTYEDAQLFISRNKDSSATHNCWAYRSRSVSRCSDDGEVGGTAGRPMLKVLENENLTDTVVIVIRHYGGINLGTGGLMRAYGGVTKSVVDKAVKVESIPVCSLEILVPMNLMSGFYSAIQIYQSDQYFSMKSMLTDENSGSGSQVTIDQVKFEVTLPCHQQQEFKNIMSQACDRKLVITDQTSIE
jgi:putative IMPACT (imprinted ancient) family translation regulator